MSKSKQEVGALQQLKQQLQQLQQLKQQQQQFEAAVLQQLKQQKVEALQRGNGMGEEKDEEDVVPPSSEEWRLVYWQGQPPSPEGRDGERWQSASHRAESARGSSSNSQYELPKQLLLLQQARLLEWMCDAQQSTAETAAHAKAAGGG